MKLPSFSVILVFVVLVISGAALVPMLSVQYKPTEKGNNLSVSYSWGGASARVIESEVTSRLEGVISTLKGVESISSTSSKNNGYISITLKEKADADAVKFELSSLVRRVYPSLPDGVSFPSISSRTSRYSEDVARPVLVYTINSAMSPLEIDEYAREYIVKELSLISGLNSVDLRGATSSVYEAKYNSEYLNSLGVTPGDITRAISENNGIESILGNRDGHAIIVKSNSGEELSDIPIKNVNGRIIRLSDVATLSLEEEQPDSFSRINGLNTINLSVVPEKGVNNLEFIREVKSVMNSLKENFPPDFSAILVDDESTDIKGELNKVYRRTILSVLILLIFVFVVSRSVRYLAIIAATLVANIFIAFIFYYIFSLEIHLYSLAGITVSLGIIIDTSIIMISHYGYYKNLKAFIAILAALLTTIGALTVVFFLPEQEKNMLMEFAAVIIINLAVSMSIALVLIPALIDQFPVKGVNERRKISSARKIVRFSKLYERYISWGRAHKWVFILLVVLGFGIPFNELPSKMDEDKRLAPLYNNTIGSNLYQNKIKKITDPLFGGSIRLFQKRASQYGGFFRDPARPELNIQASLPDGSTVQQLNDIVLYMENYLTQFPEIEMFYTNVNSYSNASIRVKFRKEVENTSFPLMLKNEVIAKAIDFGGANWRVYGIDENSFNNNIGTSSIGGNSIDLTGYNYDMLYEFGEQSAEELLKNQRVRNPVVGGGRSMRSMRSRNEYFIEFDEERMAQLNINPAGVFRALNSKLASSGSAMYKMNDESNVRVEIYAEDKDIFDVWNLRNEYLDVGERKVRFSDIGEISMRRTGNSIYKQDQQYLIGVAYDFIGSYQLASRVQEREVDRLNDEVLPIGFKAGTSRNMWDFPASKTLLLLLIVVSIIFFICSVLFESLSQPLTILLLIPVSFIGLFLTFYFTGFRFDQGGFAAFIMLSGISVNAGIYVMNQYNIFKKDNSCGGDLLRCYIKAYNNKIVPIILTIVSTILGLIPFVMEGQNEVFWFSFAVGTMGGLLFSILGIVFVMPVFGSKRR
jgi:multidrug efflux pump subunit AcrB